MVELAVPLRLRRAIVHNDVLLVKRIIKNNPEILTNPDYSDRSNTSLHLAALKGHLHVVKLLVSLGHDSCRPVVDHAGHNSAPGISLNTDHSTALHLAAAYSHAACVEFLCRTFPHSINWPDQDGMTALMLAARSSNSAHAPLTVSSVGLVPINHRPRALSTGRSGVGTVIGTAREHASSFSSSSSSSSSSEDTATISTLLAYNASLDFRDKAGNTALHYASAWGNLKAIRVLLAAGAAILPQNNAKQTPLDYSVTSQAARYFQNLITEFQGA